MTTPADRPSPVVAGFALTAVIAGLTMLGPFAIDTIFPAFDTIGKDFAASEAAMQQVTSAYLLSFAVMSVLHGPLADSLGRKPVMIVGLGGFALASVGCALAPNLGTLIVCRLLQGAFAGGATVVSRVVIRDLFSGAEAHRLMSRVMMIFSIAPAIAPVLGGFLLAVGPWPVIFWAVAGYGVLMLAATQLLIPETLPRAKRQPLSVRQVVGSLIEVSRHPAMLRLAAAMSMAFAAQFLYVVAAPIIVVRLFGLGDQDFWVLFVPMIGGVALGAWVSGALADRMGRSRIMDLSMAVALAAGVANVLLALTVPRLPYAVIAVSVLAVAVAVAFPVLQLEMLDLFPQHRGAAASFATFASLAFNAVLAGIIAPLVTGTLLTTALTSLVFTVLAVAMWGWHRRTYSPAPADATS